MGTLLLILAVLVADTTAAMSQSSIPAVYLIDRPTIVAVRQAYHSRGLQYQPAIIELLKEAKRALHVEPVSVVQKTQTPPSGDKHDYLSLGPYWWPDSQKTEGLPYIRRDGETNPERDEIADKHNLGIMVSSVQTLALAHYITDEELYAEHAVKMLRAWFIDPNTRMNPNLNYAQGIRGRNTGRGAGIIDGRGFGELVDAFGLLAGSRSLTPADVQSIKTWYGKYLTWLLESEHGRDEARAKNNHGTMYDLQVSCIALFIGKEDIARQIVESVPAKRIAVQIEPDGQQPLELVRTKSWGYGMFNLEGLVGLGLLGEHVGVDLWNFKTEDGRSIRKALDWLLPYSLDEKPWTYTQIVPMERERMYPILRLAAVKYSNPKYADAAKKIPNVNLDAHRAILLYPAVQ